MKENPTDLTLLILELAIPSLGLTHISPPSMKRGFNKRISGTKEILGSAWGRTSEAENLVFSPLRVSGPAVCRASSPPGEPQRQGSVDTVVCHMNIATGN